MKKIIIILCLFLLTGCTLLNSADKPVIEYLEKFKNHDKSVISTLDELLKLESITKEQKELYELVMKRQYTNLEYKIKDTVYNGNSAKVIAEITVYDYAKSKKEAYEIISNNENLYETKEDKMNIQLKRMNEENKRISYTIELNVFKENDKWILETPKTEVLEKIHGIYENN